MSEIELKGLDRMSAKAILRLWEDPDDRRQMMETGMTEEQMQELRKRFDL
ncbi:MAG: hypothetical protein GF416_08805 [Candidatus Altiarchaeales archaeon]|nr:hypothetical protein [Candidatus Altiarchaeales archaeon]MBD3417216.1 hypothetical protein [Candidatus Altiarchaeales archaeon]